MNNPTPQTSHGETEPAEGLPTRLEKVALHLAESHSQLHRAAEGVTLIASLDDIKQILDTATRYFSTTQVSELSTNIAAEWMLDNDYLLQQALRQVKEDLPKTYYHELPKLAGEKDPIPRIYAVALALIEYEQAQLSREFLETFIQTYQQVCPLQMGELWALPSMLRLGVLFDLCRAVVHLTGQTRAKALPAWFFAEQTISEDKIIANAISSLRMLATQDWKVFFEQVSIVESILKGDPAKIYARMDFDTRDRYRKKIEEVALQSQQTEWEVARLVVHLAQEALDHSPRDPLPDTETPTPAYPLHFNFWQTSFQFPRTAHVGYYLLDRGVERLEQLNTRISPKQAALRWIYAHATLFYLGSIGVGFSILLGLLVWYALRNGSSWTTLLFLFFLATVPLSSFVIQLVNTLITRFIPPRVLPKMDFEEEVPRACATLIVIPALLTSEAEVDSLLKQIKLHHLRNPGENLYFGLLTDFVDAHEKDHPNDAPWLERVERGIQDLNTKYARKGFAPFFLFHRERLWNPSERIWMGWERKRGKLHELNRLILGDSHTSFIRQVGDVEVLPNIRYVITLDADTILPQNEAHRLIATLAHPLNRAEFDPATQRVVAGYTILQPRTEVLPNRANQTLFTRIFTKDTGLDLYTLAVSDVYQDLFGEGIFVGKGIYEVADFERSLENRIPENTLLSHDLFEGIHGRTALVTDIVILEDYPPNYLVEVQRAHRWVRGDWQLLPWLLPKVPSPAGKRLPSRLKWIDRWKIVDNLRRSLLAPAILLFLVAGWVLFPGSPLFWTMVGVGVLGLPTAMGVIDGFQQLFAQTMPGKAFVGAWHSLLRWLLALIFLPFEAMMNLDAILTTILRLFVERRGLLQWMTAAQASRRWGARLQAEKTWGQMITVFLLSASLGLALVYFVPQVVKFAAPLVILWMISPQIAYLISRPARPKAETLTPLQIHKLRTLARLTWFFFEEFMRPEDHWLPPDHFQEAPRGVVAHRTSPTNIGLGMLSTLAAYDFGYIEAIDFVARLRSTFETLDQLEPYRGHLLNWYDTRTLSPLTPRYISTVDSGNFAASLVALGEGCRDVSRQPLLRAESWQGLADMIGVVNNLLATWQKEENIVGVKELSTYLEDFCEYLQASSTQPQTWMAVLQELSAPPDAPVSDPTNPTPRFSLGELERRLMALLEAHALELGAQNLRRLRIYIRRLHLQLEGIKRQVNIFLPWLIRLHRPPQMFASGEQEVEVRVLWGQLKALLETSLQLEAIQALPAQARPLFELLSATLEETLSPEREKALTWLQEVQKEVASAAMNIKILTIGLHELATQCERMANQMDFTFLYDAHRKVFHLGYNLELDRLDNNYYDLLASEARIASLFAISKGDVPQTHWLHLNRPVTSVGGMLALVSWSATMFEYLMPPLLLRSYEGTLLDQSARAAVELQIEYGTQNNVPWGISESGYYRFDNHMNYQYRAFGVPGLGFKRGLEDDLVIAPYASFLSLPYRPAAVLENYDKLRALGMLGTYGLYEAVDFTKERLPAGDRYAIVRSFMSHHQGMLFLALANALHDQRMVDRFHHDPYIQSVELLLQEQVPAGAPLENTRRGDFQPLPTASSSTKAHPWHVNGRTSQPRPHLLSNGHYTVLITNGGGGFSRWRGFDLTRWRADTTLDPWGTWIYVKDLDRPKTQPWSATLQPAHKTPDSYQVEYHAHQAVFRRLDGDISLVTEITVPPGDDLEIRRITLTNHSGTPRRLRLSSYTEMILAQQATDERHPTFNKLFIESDFRAGVNALFYHRRPRTLGEAPIFVAHALVMENGKPEGVAFERDRSKFLGRGHTVHRPQALFQPDHYFPQPVGSVLDPIASISCTVHLKPHQSVQLAFLTLADKSQKALQALLQRYQYWYTIERAFDQAVPYAELELRQLGLNGEELPNAQRLLSTLLYPHRALRPAADRLAANLRGQPGLWKYGISGDYPILLATIEEMDDLQLVQDLVAAHAYWRARQFKADLVILNEQGTSYGQELHARLMRIITNQKSEAFLHQNGGIFVVYADQMDEKDRTLLFTAARAVLEGRKGALAHQLHAMEIRPPRLPAFITGMREHDAALTTPPLPRPQDLQFDNGLGGASADGREYLIYLKDGEMTPLPWSNVIANEQFGFIVTESGSSYTWALNSGENRLTPWSNDPVTDPSGETLYLRDEETAEIWTPTPLPIREREPYLIRHGAGYTIFEHNSHGLKQSLCVFAAPDDPVKIIQLRLENLWERPRRITATYFAEWVLGVQRSVTQHFVVPKYDDRNQALLARNPYHEEFAGRIAFLAASKQVFGLTADRTEFLGRRGNYQNPAGVGRVGLSGAVEAGADPCAVLQLHLDLPSRGAEEIYFLLGEGDSLEHAQTLIQKFKAAEEVASAWEEVNAQWDRILGTVQVETPDPAMNYLLNRWLLYQALSCRIWGRSAFYQSSGAYGFRDQLQDVMALVYSAPELARAHILRAAAHQFEAGDVLHWWHPPSGRGVRTRMSDDLLWLPYVTAQYIQTTGDVAILEEKVPFRQGELLHPDEEERYSWYGTSEEAYSLLEHCFRALNRGLTSGRHGIPLIGTGDWNDGMNRVGAEGHGESIWLGWFLNITLKRFAEVCERIGNLAQANIYRDQAVQLVEKLEQHTWDGHWYLRAFYDDGSPLGSAQNRECQIDAIAQSWAVFSGDGDPARARQAMQAVLEKLVRREDGLILLFTPPFDKTPRDPGYIRGYLPGIRENGGQYTHAAIWSVWAFAELGEGNTAMELFNLLNPLTHADDPGKVERYKVEPYVIAADVYGVVPHVGRGGWTWYTGSSGWMYRLGIEGILGLRKEGDRLRIAPCIPQKWVGFQIQYRHGGSVYQIVVQNPEGICQGVRQITLDGTVQADGSIPLTDDGQMHEVIVEMGKE